MVTLHSVIEVVRGRARASDRGVGFGLVAAIILLSSCATDEASTSNTTASEDGLRLTGQLDSSGGELVGASSSPLAGVRVAADAGTLSGALTVTVSPTQDTRPLPSGAEAVGRKFTITLDSDISTDGAPLTVTIPAWPEVVASYGNDPDVVGVKIWYAPPNADWTLVEPISATNSEVTIALPGPGVLGAGVKVKGILPPACPACTQVSATRTPVLDALTIERLATDGRELLGVRQETATSETGLEERLTLWIYNGNDLRTASTFVLPVPGDADRDRGLGALPGTNESARQVALGLRDGLALWVGDELTSYLRTDDRPRAVYVLALGERLVWLQASDSLHARVSSDGFAGSFPVNGVDLSSVSDRLVAAAVDATTFALGTRDSTYICTLESTESPLSIDCESARTGLSVAALAGEHMLDTDGILADVDDTLPPLSTIAVGNDSATLALPRRYTSVLRSVDGGWEELSFGEAEETDIWTSIPRQVIQLENGAIYIQDRGGRVFEVSTTDG